MQFLFKWVSFAIYYELKTYSTFLGLDQINGTIRHATARSAVRSRSLVMV
jgi:hypothetical protein